MPKPINIGEHISSLTYRGQTLKLRTAQIVTSSSTVTSSCFVSPTKAGLGYPDVLSLTLKWACCPTLSTSRQSIRTWITDTVDHSDTRIHTEFLHLGISLPCALGHSIVSNRRRDRHILTTTTPRTPHRTDLQVIASFHILTTSIPQGKAHGHRTTFGARTAPLFTPLIVATRRSPFCSCPSTGNMSISCAAEISPASPRSCPEQFCDCP